MTWFIFSIFSIFALATAELTQQHLLNKKNSFDERTSAVLTFFIQSIITVPLLFMFGVTDQIFSVFNPLVFPKVLLVTFLASISMVLYLKSFKVKNISISTIFISFSVVISTFLGIIFFSESVNHLKFIGIGLILIAVISMNYKNAVLEKNHWYGLIASLLLGIEYTLDKSIALNIHPLIFIFWASFMVAAWGFIMNAKKVVNSVKCKKLFDYRIILISSIFYFMFNFFTFTAYTFGGEVGRVDAINNSQTFLIILFEFFILKHTKGTVRKLLAATVAIAGVLILGFTS